MARIRSIKPEFFVHEDLTQLSPLHRLLFAGLWTQADREGRLEDRPRRLKVQLLPFDACDVDALLADLDRAEFIHRYVVDGAAYIAIPSFLDHQRPREDERESEIPIPPPRERQVRKQAVTTQELTLLGTDPSLRSDGSGTTQSLGKEGKGIGKGTDVRVAELVALWNEITAPPLPRVRELSVARAAKARARLKEHPELEWWRTAFGKAQASDFCRGGSGRWSVTFDWMMTNDTNAVKVYEGNYDNRHDSAPVTALEAAWGDWREECEGMGHDPAICVHRTAHEVVCARAKKGAA